MPDLSPVAPELKVWEFLEFFAAAYGIPKAQRKARVDDALDRVKMTEHRDAMGKGLSRGMTQRVVLGQDSDSRTQDPAAR